MINFTHKIGDYVKITKKYIIYIILGILLIVGSLTAFTFAYLKTEDIQEEKNVMSTMSCMEVTINGQTEEIKLNNAYPMSIQQGMETMPYTFKVSNKCDTYVEYRIVMSVLSSSTLLNENYIKVSLEGPTVLRPLSLDLLEKESAVIPIENTLNNYVLIKNQFENTEEHTYDFRMWLNQDASEIFEDEDISNKNLKVKLSIIAITTTKPDKLKLSSNEEYFLGTTILRDQIESIEFSTEREVPETAIDSWDVSFNNNKSILAWIEQGTEENLYKFTIGQNSGVIANEDSKYLFSNLPNIKVIDLSNLNTRYVTDMSYMFYNIGELSENTTIIGLQDLDTSSTIDMSYMFSKSKIDNLDLSLWYNNNVVRMNNMFEGTQFQSLRIDKWSNLPNETLNMFDNILPTSKIFVKDSIVKEKLISKVPENIEIITLN